MVMNVRAHRLTVWLLAVLLVGLVCGLAACDASEPVETVPATDELTAATEEPTAAPTVPPTEAPSEAPTEPTPVVYHVCLDPKDPEGTAFRTYESLEEAKTNCNRRAQLGYRVVSSEGETVYLPYTELQCDILRECKAVTDYVREKGYKYGDATINPAMDKRMRKVSCDRFVAWALYNVGFTDQPRTQGVVVSRMAAWCEKNGFERIDREEDLQPGDVVLVKYNGSWPAHTFIYAGESRMKGQPYRYDCGSNTRIQSVQPSTEPIVQFWRAYRPVADSPARETGEIEIIP